MLVWHMEKESLSNLFKNLIGVETDLFSMQHGAEDFKAINYLISENVKLSFRVM